MLLRRFFLDPLCNLLMVLLALILLVLIAATHAHAQVVAAPPSAPALVQIQPLLHDLLTMGGIVLMAVVPLAAAPLASAIAQKFHLSSDATVREALINLASQAAYYGESYADAKIRRVNGLDTGDPKIAAAANWLLTHASGEIEHFNLTPEEVVGVVKAAIAWHAPGAAASASH